MVTHSPIARPIPFLRSSITKTLLILLLLGTTTMTICTGLLLQGKKVLVTGGGRGIGRAIALICHDHGAKVIVTSRTQSELEETLSLAAHAEDNQIATTTNDTPSRLTQSSAAAQLLSRRGTTGRSRSPSPGKATSVGARRTGSASKARRNRSSLSQLVDAVKTGSSTLATATTCDDAPSSSSPHRMSYFVCDVTDEGQVEATIQNILEREGAIDVVINNAGGSQSSKGPVGTLSSQDLTSLLKLNVVGPNLVTSAVCKHAEGWRADDDADELTDDDSSFQKVILNISSKAGKMGLENYSFYVATKFALEGLTSSWAKELQPRNIRVHSLSPGMVDTRSFPKPEGKKGVREASSIEDVLLLILTGRVPNDDDASTTTTVVENMMEYTGHYIHADEYDQVVNEKGVSEGYLSFKRIDEEAFRL